MSELRQAPTIERLRELFAYDPETGVVTRIQGSRIGNRLRKPPKANDYVKFGADGVTLLGHRIAWALSTGDWPRWEIDHINGVRSDNRLVNLRDVPRSFNAHNRHAIGGKSGILGVFFRANRWDAKIGLAGKRIHIGCFKTKEEAQQAYVEAKRRLHQGCTI